jgi:hypothetical protein
MVRRFLPLSLILLAGCALSPPGIVAPATPVEVSVPVYEPVYCPAPPLANPRLPIAGLTPQSPPADTLRAYAASIVLLKAAVRQLDDVLEGCAEPAATSLPAGGAAPIDGAPTLTPPASPDGRMADSVSVTTVKKGVMQ